MIESRDSSFDRPTLAQARAARAAGVGFWWGYLATRPNVGLAAPWSRADFADVQQAGLGCGAMVSGWDDPVALRQLATSWGIPLLCLDDEDGIRRLTQPDWRPAFLRALGGGHYGLMARLTLPAQFRIVAAYPAGGCTGATWPTSPAPAMPHGWQCQGTHRDPVTGLSVDSGNLDDWFGGQTMELDPNDPVVVAIRGDLAAVADLATKTAQETVNGVVVGPDGVATQLPRILAAIEAGNGAVPAQVIQDIADLKAAVSRIEAALKGA